MEGEKEERERRERERLGKNEEEGSKTPSYSRPAGAWAPRYGRSGTRPPERYIVLQHSQRPRAPRRPVHFFFFSLLPNTSQILSYT